MVKRIVSLILTVIIGVVSCYTTAFAQADVERMDEIINIETLTENFIEYCSAAETSTRAVNNTAKDKANEFIAEYQEEIMQLGYLPYIVSRDNYHEQEESLNTNFQDMGLNKECVYLVLLEGTNNTRAAVSGSYNYVYNGKSYILRKVIITAVDDSIYSKASSCNLLASSSKTLIENCLNAAISAYISSVCQPLGTVASICGLNISMFSTIGTSTIDLNCGTNWTRKHTQVYNESTGDWTSGSSVEYAKMNSYLSGHYYSASGNEMLPVPEKASSSIKYSDHYEDNTWQNQQAIIYSNNLNGIHYDITGAIEYKYNDTVKVIHNENF